MTSTDDHDHDHDHATDERTARVRALQSLLIEKGVLSTDAIDEIIDAHETTVGPMNGKRVVARAWTDASFKDRLLTDPGAAIAELGFEITQGHLRVVENTPDVHNVVVCTLCSCYPWSLLGLPPTWYKSHEYRSRTVREPRAVLEEFGLTLGDDVEVKVWDSTSELRYFVLPQRPPGTDSFTEDELVDLIPKNAMIGVEQVPSPSVTA